MSVIAEAVGEKSPNKPVDVVKIQALVNNNDIYTGLYAPLEVDGIASDALVKAIKMFQSSHPDIKAAKPDGKVSPGGRTLARLNEYNNRQSVCRDYYPRGFWASYFSRFNIDRFVNLYKL